MGEKGNYLCLAQKQTAASASVKVSAANGANQIASLPNIMGRQKMARAFTIIPLFTAMAFAAPVLLVEKRNAVQIRFNAIGIKDRPNSGKTAEAVCTSSASRLKMQIIGLSKKNNNA